MNRNQAQRLILALIVIAFTFLGNSIGYFVDQAATASIDPDLWLRLQQCGNCVDAMVPLAGALAKANQWTILGSLIGFGLGLVVAYGVGWYLRPRKTGPIRRLSGFRQASELARFSQALTDTLDPQRILVQLHTEVLHVTGADCGSSFLLDPTSPEHRIALRAGEGQDLQRLNPMEAEAVVSGRSRVVPDFESEGLPPPHVGIRSALLVPITHEENAIGLIHLHSQQPATFDAEFLDYVQVLAAQAAVAIHNAQRYEEQSRRSEALRQRVNQLQQLALIPNTVRVDRPLSANLESIAQTMQDTAGFGLVLISVYQPAGNHLDLAASTGLSAAVAERLHQQPVPWERLQPFLREEFRSNRVFLVPHTQTAEVYAALDLDRPLSSRATPPAPGQWHPDDLLLVPLFSPRGEIEGLLTLSAPRDVDTPQNLVFEILEVFASQTALAIENALALTQAEARLNEAQGRAVQMGALTEVSGAIVGTLRVAEVIPLALDQLRRLIAYDSASFWKRDLNDNRWVLSGARSTHEDPERVAQRAERSQPTLFTEIAATRSVLSVPDVTRDPRFSLKEAGMMRSWLGVPVLNQGEVTGVLVLEKAEDNYYGAAQAPLALAFANRLALALENAQRYEESVGHAQDLETENTRRALEAERRAQRLSLLNRLAAELGAAGDQAAVLASALPILRDALGADSAAGVVLELDTPNATPYVVAQGRLPADDLPLLPLTDNPLLERLLEAAAPLVVEVDRAPLDAALLRPESLAWVGPGLGTALFVPLTTEGRLAGLLGLGLAGGRRFSPADLDLAWSVGQQAGMALHNLRLRERTQEQAAANQMVRALSRAADRPDLYGTLREQLASVAGLPQLSLALYDEARNTVSFPLIVEGAAGYTADLTPRPAVGLVRHVLQSRRTVRLAGDLAAQAQTQTIDLPTGQPLVRADAPSATAYLAAPLLLGERVVGVLVAYSADSGASFSDRQERLLAAAAAQAAVALDNLQLYEQARQGLAASQARATELEALSEAGKALSGTLRVPELIATLLDQLQTLTPYTRAVVWLRGRVRRKSAEWQAAATRQPEGERPLDRLNLAAGSPLAEVLNTRRAGLVPDTGRDPRFGGAARAWLGLPVFSGGEVAALVELEAAPGAFTAEQAALAQAFALRAGPALENARQHAASLDQVAALDEQARRLTYLNTTALSLTGSLDFETQRAAAARALADSLRAEQTLLVVWSPEGRLRPVTALPAEAGAAATAAALAAAAPLWDGLRSEAAPPPITLAELRGTQGLPPEQLAWLGPAAGSGLLLPLTTNAQTVGAAILAWAAPERPFTVDEIETAQYVARLAAAALAAAAQYELTQQRLSEQATANLIGRAMSQALDVPELAERLRAQLDAWLKPAQITLALYDAARHEVSFPLAVSAGRVVSRPPQAPDPLLHHLLRTQQPLLVASEPAALTDLGLPASALDGARNLLGVPLRLADQLLGVLTLADPARAEAFTESHQRILSAVALQVAITLENARTHTEELARAAALTERAEKLAWLDQVSAQLSGTLDPQQVAGIAAQRLAEILSAEQSSAVLLDGDGSEAQVVDRTSTADQPLRRVAVTGHPLLERLLPRLRSEASPVVLDDLTAEPALAGAAADLIGPDTGAASFVPLTFNEQVVGVIGLGRARAGAKYTPLQSELAAAVARQAGLALTNARRHVRTQRDLTAERNQIEQTLTAERDEVAQRLTAERDQVAQRLTAERDQVEQTLTAERDRVAQRLAAERDALEQQLTGERDALEQQLTAELDHTRTQLSAELADTRTRLTDELERTQQRLSEQATAGLISRALSQALDLPHLADLLREQLEAWLKPAQLTLALYDAARHEVTFPLATRAGQVQTLPPQAPSPLLHHLLANRQPLLLNGATGAAQLQELGLPADAADGARSFLGLPLRLNDAVVGVLAVADPARTDALTDGQQRVLNTVALQIAITLENVRRYAEGLARIVVLEDRAQRLGWLQQLSLDLGGQLDQPQLLTTALRQLAGALEADQAGVLLLDEAAGAPVAQLAAHLPAETAASLLAPIPVAGHPLFERLAEDTAPVVLDDPAAERLIRPEHTRWVGFELRAVLFVPLSAQGRLVGVLGLGRSQARRWSPGDVELAAGAAQHTALALAHARRHADSQQRLAEQATLSQVLRAVGAAADLDQLLELLRARLPGWVGAHNLYLALFDETRDLVTLPLLAEGGRLRSVAPSAPAGLVRHVLQTRHPVSLSGDVNQQARDLGLPLHPDGQRPERWSTDLDEVLTANTCLAVPILHGEKALGVLAVESTAHQPFSDAHERLLAAIAAQTALVLDNGRLLAETRQALAAAQERVAQLEALTTALSNVAAALYSEDVTGLALEQFRRVLPYDHATFWQRESTVGSGRELRWRLAGTRGYPEAEARQAFGLDNTYQALFGELVVGRRPLLVADTSRDSRFGAAQNLSPRTWLGLPLVAQGEVIGLLVLEKLQPDAYAPAQVAPAMILANQVSAVLSNARAFEANAHRAIELDERTRRLAFLNRFGAELANHLDLGRLMQLTLKAMTEAMGLEQATGAVFDEQRTALLALEHYPDASGGGRAGRAALPGNFLLERLQEAPTPITLEDVGAPEAPQRLLRQADWIGQEVGAAMFVPLVHNGSLLGLVGLGQSEAGRHFTPAETELGMALANQAAAAVNQARLFERAQQRLAEQASINQLNRALSRAVDRRALAETLRQQIEAWVDAASVHLAVYDEDRHAVSFPLAIVNDQPVALEPRAPSGLLEFLLQRRQPLRLNGEIPTQLQALGIYTTGLAAAIGLDDVAAFTSYLAVPLLTGERVAGALLLGGPRRTEAFDESHERILSAVGAQLAAALDHTRQFEQTREITAASQTRAAQFSTLTDAAGVIAGGLRTEQVLSLMLDQVQRLLPYERAQVWRPLPAPVGQTARWQLAAQRGSDADPAVTLDLSDPTHSALGELLAARTSVVTPDTSVDPRFNRPGAWLGLPLLHKGEVLGLLALERDTPHAYTAAQLPLAQAFGSQAAVALANVALYEDSLRRAAALDARTSLLNRVSTALNNTLEPAELFQAALAALAETLRLDHGAVIVFDEGRAAGWLRPLLLFPAAEVDQAGSLALTNNPLLEHLRDSLAPIAVEDTAHNALVTAEHTTWIAPELRSALFLPLVVAGKLIGLLGLGHSQEQRRFTASDLELAMTVANQAAIASHNAGLYQRTHRRLVELATISQNSRAIGQTIDLQQLYQTVRTQVDVALKADTLTLALYDEFKDELTFPLAVEHGQAVELTPRAPDRLMRHLLTTRQPLLLTGEVSAKLVELGLAGDGAAPLRAKSYLGVPLVAGTKVRGVLVVEDFKRAYAFTDKHEQSLVTIAAPIAAAVDGAALYEQSAQKAMALNARSALLGRVAAELSETTDLDNLLRFTTQVIAETLLTNVGAAVVLDEDPGARKALRVARYPAADGDGSTPITPDHPVVQQLQARLAPLPLDELTGAADLPTELLAWLGPDVASALFLPLITGEQVIGLVAVGETNAGRGFTSGELDLAMTLANQAAVAIANARLQQRVQPRLVELATITRLSRALGQATTLPQLTETLQSELAATLKAETIYLALWDAPRNQLTFPLVYDGRQTLAARPQTPGGAIKFLLEQRQSLLLNGSIARQLAARNLTYQPVLAGAAAPQSFLGVPLLLGARAVGALVVEDHNQIGKFGPSHEIILSTVAAQIAAVAENALLQIERTAQTREIEERAAQLALVNRLSVALLGASDPAAILRQTLDALHTAVGAAHAAALYPVGSGQWAVVRPTGQPAAPDPLDAPSALLALVDGAGQVLAVSDLAAAHSPAAAQLGWLAPAPRALLLLPVRLDGAVAALLALAEDAPRAFEPRVVELSVTCANQAAIALENSRLYQQARRIQATVADQARQFGALAAVQQHIVVAADVETVAAAALAELPHVVAFDRAALWLRDSTNPGRLRVFPATRGQAAVPSYDAAEPPFFADLLASGARPVSDAPAEQRPAPSGDPAMRSWLGVPLGQAAPGSQEPLLGALVVEQAAQGAYLPEHLNTLQAVAAPLAARLAQTQQQAAAAAQRRAVESEAHRLTLLQQVTGAVLQTLDLHAVLRSALTELLSAVPADQAAALVFAAAGESGPLVVQHPAHNTTAPLPLPGHPALARMQREGVLVPVVLNDPAAEGLVPADNLWLGAEPVSALFLPLTAGGAWLGLLGLGSAAREGFPPERVALAQALTAQLGVAVQNARAHQQVERDLQVQTALNRFGPALAGVQSAEQLAAALRDQIDAVFDTRTFYLAQLDASGQVSFPALVENGQARAVPSLPPQGVIQHVLQSQQLLALHGAVPAQLRELGLPAAGARARREAGDPSPAAAYLAVPVLNGDEALGVLAIETSEAGAEYTPLHATLLTALAEHTAAALVRLRTAAELVAARQHSAQVTATAQALEQQLQAQGAAAHTQAQALTEAARAAEQALAETTHAAEQQLAERSAAFAAWRDRYAALLAAHPQASRAALDAALAQALRVAGQAVGADYSALYLTETGQLEVRAAYGTAAGLSAGRPQDLADAAFTSGEAVLIPDLTADPRWTGAPAPALGANGHTPESAAESETAAPADATAETVAAGTPAVPPASNGHYHSGLALPLGPGAGQPPLGALLFFSARPAAFTPEAAAVGAAAADQIAYTLEHADRLQAWQAQAAALRSQLAEDAAPPAAGPDRPAIAIRPITPPTPRPSDETVQVTSVAREAVPAHREPVPALPVTVAPTLGEPEPLVRPNPTPLWRRLALPVGALALLLCVGVALTAGPLRGLFGANPAATATLTTATLPAVVETDTVAAPATEAPASPTVAVTATTEPTVAPTATATVEPSATVTALPTASPTQPLPADVLAVATVNLAEGIVGRLRDAPNGNVVGGLNSGTVVHVISARQTTPDGITWVRIRLPDTGQTGWVGESLLQYSTAPPG